jgi:hypothetical protein
MILSGVLILNQVLVYIPAHVDEKIETVEDEHENGDKEKAQVE